MNPVNDPARSEHGAPDFIFFKKEIIVGYAETKDIDVDLDKVSKSEQLVRYYGYSNLILTNYLEFRFYRNGEQIGESLKIAEVKNGAIVAIENNLATVQNFLADFLSQNPEKIKSGLKLSKIMGGKARRIRDNVAHYLKNDTTEKSNELNKIYQIVKNLLVHDLSAEKFADMYAQTLVYGLFVARYHDNSSETFTRQEARDLVPATNPFLRHFFDHIVGPDFDKRLSYIVDELCEIFSLADVKKLLGEYFKEADPIIHFYEDFLKEYDAKQRLELGVFYTPAPVVSFIVRSIDEILKKDFGLTKGLADTSKIRMRKEVQGYDLRTKDGKKYDNPEVHRVQVLDPAVGTGSFLNEVIKQIHKSFVGQQGRWQSYVTEDLLPRIHGFEIMMASYTIAHLKLSMTLKETGYNDFSERIGVYLTNSLEEGQKIGQDLFSSVGLMETITEEAHEAGKIKKDYPIMVVLGNPPYSISSQNKGQWILDLIKDYKKDLGEKKINIDDDYIKFIRFAEHFIEKNGEGIVGMITNNSFIEGITHRQMRKHLLETFDKIYILDLHGNMRKGEKDQNVFDIMQGVSISLLVKNNTKKDKLAEVYYSEFLGNRQEKYEALDKNDAGSLKWSKLDYKNPYYFFVPKDFGLEDEYEKGFNISELMSKYSSGIETQKDLVAIQSSRNATAEVLADFKNISTIELKQKYQIKDSRDWKVEWAKQDLQNIDEKYIVDILYRPFDIKNTIYTGNSKGFIGYPRADIMNNLVMGRSNLVLLTCKRQTTFPFQHVFISNIIAERCSVSLQTGEVSYAFPLYIYSNDDKIPNFNKEILKTIEATVGETAPEDIMDYIYAVLHSQKYRKKYKEFLKIDFPRVPYPESKDIFWKLVEKGKELRELHLLESKNVNDFITTFPITGNDEVGKVSYDAGSVYINKDQYFGNVPETAWNFYIGGYQPAQKWLKDRKGRKLSNQGIEHYQKIIVALIETDKLMKEIDGLMP